MGKSRYMCRGNLKMNGKKTMLLPCTCCDAWNKKKYPSEAELKRILEKLNNGKTV